MPVRFKIRSVTPLALALARAEGYICALRNSYVTGPRFVAVLLHCTGKSTRALARVLLPCNETATNRGHVT